MKAISRSDAEAISRSDAEASRANRPVLNKSRYVLTDSVCAFFRRRFIAPRRKLVSRMRFCVYAKNLCVTTLLNGRVTYLLKKCVAILIVFRRLVKCRTIVRSYMP